MNLLMFSKEINETLDSINRRLASIEIAVTNLDLVRRSLMTKYDEGFTTATTRLRELEAENKTLRTGMPIDIAKISQKLSRLHDDINELKEKS